MSAVLDTNALMLPVEGDLRLFDELERLGVTDYLTPKAVIEELAALADGGSEEARAASVGLDLAERCAVRETDADYADDAVLELARAPDVDYAVTNDEPLRDRLLAESVPVIGLRGGTKLAITQP